MEQSDSSPSQFMAQAPVGRIAMTGIAQSEVKEKLAELKKNLDERAQNIISSDPGCAEIRGNIAALEWRFEVTESKE